MNRIGILTFWNVPNYGSFLQAYAMQSVLEEMYPNAVVEQIAYLDKVHYRSYYGIFDFRYKLWFINPKFYLNALKRVIKYRRIKDLKSFTEYYQKIPHTKSLTKDTLIKEHFNTVVLGSDIVWDYATSLLNNDPFLFGNYLNADNIISYAASVGTAKLEDEVPAYVKSGLKRLSRISVREEKSAKVIEKVMGEKPEIVIDPTFLWDFSKDCNIVSPNIGSKYMIVYGSYFSEELIKGACEYAKKNNLKIVCLNSLDDEYDWCDINISQNTLSPFEWAGYFAQAEVVFTCTFHGLMFGLIYNKKIVFSPTQFIIDKASSLMDYLNITDVMLKDWSFEEKVNWNWNYEKINKKIFELRENSYAFLREAIGDIN